MEALDQKDTEERKRDMLKKLKENNKKGFTLVELIVVLVILAILAALLVPALTGYIDKAKRKSVVAETRQVVMSAQTLVDEAYGTVATGTKIEVGDDKAVKPADILKLAELTDKGTISNVTLDATNKITKLTFTESTGSKYECTYEPGNSSNSDGDYNIPTK